MSQVTRFVEIIPASGRIDRPRGNFWLLLSSTVSLNVTMERDGSSEQFNGITGGIRVRRVVPWNALTMFGAPGGQIEFFFGADEVNEDDVNVFLQVATIAGVALFAESPSATIATPADNALPAATTENIAANLLRRRITIGVLSTETVGVRVQAVGAADASGIEVQPGTFVELKTTASIDIRNNDGAVATSYYILEES